MTARLHVRLAGVLFLLLLLQGAVSMVSLLWTSRLHRAEANQAAHLDLAANIARSEHGRLIGGGGQARDEQLSELFHWMMVVNPGLQFYLLDPQGRVLAYDPMPGPVAVGEVSLKPVQRLLGPAPRLPVFGDDPRDPSQRKIFSVAPIDSEGDQAGYLYVVLDNAPAESALDRLHSSAILRTGLGTGLLSLVLALSFGAFLFNRLTGPLRRLTARMRSFRSADSEDGDGDPLAADEVSQLAATFDAMAARIDDQVVALERMAATRHELISNVSHDLRTPIAMLLGYLETLAIKGDHVTPAEREQYLGIALVQARRLQRLVEHLFELTKLETDEVAAQAEVFLLPELLQDNVQHFELPAREKGVALRAELATDLPPVVADIGLIERVLQNLIENALRHTPEGGEVTVSVRGVPASGASIDHGARNASPGESGGRLEVVVADTGCGIPPEDQQRVFERYCRRDPSRGEDEGLGLGLAISQKIVQLHGGELTVRSELDRGAAFHFTLPVAPSSD